MNHGSARGLAAVLLVATAANLYGDVPQLSYEAVIPFSGKPLADPENLSGIAMIQGLVALCGDETWEIDILKSTPASLKKLDSLPLEDEGTEIDMEGLAASGTGLYVVGSHSLARKSVKPDKTYEDNLARIEQVNEDEARNQLIRLEIDRDGSLKSKKRISLHKLLKRDPILGRFLGVPSKENGIDIEGIAASGETLYVGFRGPVLRGNYVPVMSFAFDEPEKYTLLFLNLQGNGIRDITAVKDGFLVLAGPVGDAPLEHSLYFWDGKDCLVGQKSPEGHCSRLATLKPVSGGKAEGISVIRETETEYELWVVFDGLPDGVYRYRVIKNR